MLLQVIRQYTATMPQLRIIEASGSNIARGRNIATAAADSEIIATIDFDGGAGNDSANVCVVLWFYEG